MWDPLPLPKFFDCLFVELPGHGKSGEEWGRNLSIAQIGHSLHKLLVQIGFQPDAVVGHSLGGYVALELAQYLLPTAQIVLMHSNFWVDSDDKKRDRERVAECVRLKKEAFIREAFPNLFIQPEQCARFLNNQLQVALQMNAESVAQASLAMRNRRDFTDWVHRNVERVCLIQGELDPIQPIELALSRCAILEHFYIVPKAGHMGHVENPTDLMAVLEQKINSGFSSVD